MITEQKYLVSKPFVSVPAISQTIVTAKHHTVHSEIELTEITALYFGILRKSILLQSQDKKKKTCPTL